MKTKFIIPALMLAASIAACSSNNKVEPGTYVDLNTGDTITVLVDPNTGYAVNTATNKPVYLYVNQKNDTIFTTGQNVNNMIMPMADGKYEIDGAKVKIEDPMVKIKYDDYRNEYQVDLPEVETMVTEEGPMKIKEGDYKKKVEKDGDVKIKTDDTKTKIEDGKAVTKDRHKIL